MASLEIGCRPLTQKCGEIRHMLERALKILSETKFIVDERGCHIWPKSCASSGYGQIVLTELYAGPSGKRIKRCFNTHKLAWIAKYGEPPKGQWVLHTCDNRRCFNILHIYLGTHKSNMQDMAAKGRASGWQKKIDNVTDIKKRLAEKVPQRLIAKEFGIDIATVSKINRGKLHREA